MSLKKMVVPFLCVTAIIAAAVNVWGKDTAAVKAAPQEKAEAAGLMDKRALDTLKLMSDTIKQAKSLQFQARSMVPIRTPSGVWINLYGTSSVVLEGKDKLFASTAGDFAPYDFYFDGKTITRYSPDKNLYSVKEDPGTINDMIEKAYREEGKSFPYADILVSEPYDNMTEGLVSALYVGQSVIKPLSGAEGIKTDHLVFSNKNVQWQIWVDAVDHLPRLVSATYLDDASEPSYTVEFGGWKLDEPVGPETFIFKNASQAAKVEFRNPMQKRRDVADATTAKK